MKWRHKNEKKKHKKKEKHTIKIISIAKHLKPVFHEIFSVFGI
jgi:hypothetical protein